MKKLLLTLFTVSILTQVNAQDSTAFQAMNGTANKRYVTVPTPIGSNLRIDTSWTIEAWVFVPLTAANTQMFIVEAYSGGNTGGFALRLNNNTIQAYQIANPSNLVPINGSSALTKGTWNHIAATLNEVTQQLSVYLNGVSNGQISCTLLTSNTNPNLYIGARGDDQNIHQPVVIDEVRIWNYAKTAAQILSNMDTCLSGSEADLLAYYSFETTNSASVKDDSGNNNDGTISNFDPSCLLKGPFSCGNPTGITEYNKGNVVLYPNPASTTLTIESKSAIQQVSIYNLTGNLVQVESKNTFSIELLPSGIYLAKIETKNGLQAITFHKE